MLIKFLIFNNRIISVRENRLSSSNKQFFMNQLVWIGISFAISITISMLLPFPISLVAIVGTFLLLNYYLRRRMMSRIGNASILSGMFSPTLANGGSLKYYCMNCGKQHRQAACPKCGSKMKRIG